MCAQKYRPSVASQAQQPKSLDGCKVIPVFVSVVAVTGAFTLSDVFLVRVALKHRTETGSKPFTRANEAKSAARNTEALQLFRAAHNRNPSNPEYHLAFAQA